MASESAKSVVEIVGISGEQDWIDESYDNKNSVSGLIIADNGQELLIYGKTSILRDTKEDPYQIRGWDNEAGFCEEEG